MKLFLVLSFITLCASKKRDIYDQDSVSVDACIDNDQAVNYFRAAIDSFSAKISMSAARKGKYSLTISPLEIWITLAAIAEGADYATEQELFYLLNLPEDSCSRQKMYLFATTRALTNKYVNLEYKRTLLIDEGVQIHPTWYNLVRQTSLLQVIPVPLKQDPITTTEVIKQIISSKTLKPNLNGYSVILNAIDFNGLWTTAFADATVRRAPFYSNTGKQIGTVDLMRVRKRVRTGYVASTNLKVIELPIGANEEYSMIFGLVVNNNPNIAPAVSRWTNSTVMDMLAALQEDYVPVDIAIPKFVMNAEINVREILEEMGVRRLWNDPAATRYTSTPSARPSSYIQRASITLSNKGVNQPPYEKPSNPANYDERYWQEFIADRPFIFGLFDTETYTCLMVTMYTQPTYS